MNVIQSHKTNASVHLDAIRGIAALAVFFGHGRSLFLLSGLASAQTSSRTTATPRSEADAAPRMTVGHEAVVVFFVLSGYFVGGSVIRSVKNASFAWKPYLFQRLTRLWIVLLPALLLGLILDWTGLRLLSGPGSIYTGIAPHLVASSLQTRLTLPTLLANIFFFQNTVLTYLGTNVALWSLACEFWYYVFFPLLLGTLLPGTTAPRRIIYTIFLVASILICGPGVTRYFPLWLAGCGITILPLRLPASWQRPATGIATALLLATLAACLRLPIDRGLGDIAICLAFCPLLWVIVHNRRPRRDSLYARGAESLAAMSYTLYASHYPMLVFACALSAPVWSSKPLSPTTLAQTLLVFFAVLLVAAGMYRLFERNTGSIRLLLTRSAPLLPLTQLQPNQPRSVATADSIV